MVLKEKGKQHDTKLTAYKRMPILTKDTMPEALFKEAQYQGR